MFFIQGNKRDLFIIAGVIIVLAIVVVMAIYYKAPSNRSIATTTGGDSTIELEKEEDKNIPVNSEPSPSVVLPYLFEMLDFQEEDVKAISVELGGMQKDIPDNRLFVLLQSLRWTDTTVARAEQGPQADDEKAMLHFILQDHDYDLLYNLSNNTFEVEGVSYYADDQVLLLMQGLLREDSELAVLDIFLENARVEQESAGSIDPMPLNAEQTEMGGLDFNGWETKLQDAEVIWKIPYYDDGTGEVKEARKFSNGILMLNRQIIFTNDSYATQDDVKVGITLDQVMTKLGPEALKLVSRWSYKVGDYYKFHLYYNDNKVKYIVISQPL